MKRTKALKGTAEFQQRQVVRLRIRRQQCVVQLDVAVCDSLSMAVVDRQDQL